MWLKFGDLNLLAVLVAALATFFLGALWYTALFGKLWISLHGYSEEKVKEMQAKLSPAVFFGGMIGSYLLAALVVALLVVGLNVAGAADGAVLGAALWLGLAAAIGFTAHLASDKPIGIFLIDAGFQFVFLVMMGVILALWR